MIDHPRLTSRAASAALVSMLTSAILAAPAFAQTAAAAPPPTYGPPVAGVCVFNRAFALERSQAGQSVSRQMAQFAQTIKTELSGQKSAIEADDKVLAQRKPSLTQAQFQQGVNQLRARYAGLDRVARERQDQMERTAKDAAGLIGRATEPAISEVITQRKCSLVVDTAVVFGANPAMDITGPVVQLLNQRLPSVTVRLAPPRA